jgi:hypothetical protein
MIRNYPSHCAFSLARDSWDRLILIHEDGRCHTGIEPVRTFPISDPRHGISLCDAEGHEILCIEDLDDLPAEVADMLECELARREFAPTIERIVKISDDAEQSEWEVETDHGATRFRLAGDDNVRRLDEKRAVVVDTHGIRYLIPDAQRLDAGSQRILGRYL